MEQLSIYDKQHVEIKGKICRMMKNILKDEWNGVSIAYYIGI